MGKDNSNPTKCVLQHQVEQLNNYLKGLEKTFEDVYREIVHLEYQQNLIKLILENFKKSVLSLDGNTITTEKKFEQSPAFFGLELVGNSSPYVNLFLEITKDDFEGNSKLCKQVSNEIFTFSKEFVENSLIELNKHVTTVQFYLKSCSGCECSGIKFNYDFYQLIITNFIFTIYIS